MSEVRLIDANELKALRELYIQGKLQFIGNEYDLIDKCPTIDAEPVQHGRWTKITGMAPPELHGLHYCSVCNEPAPRDKHFREMFSNYCPACGAKMDKEK